MKYRLILAIVFSAIISAGCTQTTTLTQIETFSSSVESLTKSTDNLLSEYNSSTVKAQLIALKGQHIPGGNNLSFDELSSVQNVFDLDTKKKLSIYKANSALMKYAKGLSGLAKSSNSESVAKASSTLVNSFNSMETSYQGLKGDDQATLINKELIGTIGGGIAVIGGAIVDEKRKKALKDIIVKADPIIVELTSEITSTIKNLAMGDDLKTNAQFLLAAKIADYNRLVESGVYRTKHDNQINDLNSLWEEYQILQASEARLSHLSKSITAISTQHSKIAKEVSENRFSSEQIMSAVAEIKAMENRYASFKDSAINCEKLKINNNGEAVCDE